jgi:hypothetical protein
MQSLIHQQETPKELKMSDIKVTPGFYLVNAGAFKVRTSKTTGRLYAMKLDTDTGKFEYDKGAIFNLRPETRMTKEQAAAYGHKTGRCMICGRELSNEESLKIGIGPICLKGF